MSAPGGATAAGAAATSATKLVPGNPQADSTACEPHAPTASFAAGARSNAEILAAIDARYTDCVSLLDKIASKPTIKAFSYVVRIPLKRSTPATEIADPTSPAERDPPASARHTGRGLPAVTVRKLAQVVTPTFEVEEVVSHIRSQDVLTKREVAAKLFKLSLDVVDDYFNDKVNYGCGEYSDVARLAKALWPVAKKFSLFGESGNVSHLLSSFLSNYEKLLAALGAAWEEIQDPASQRATIQAKLDAANVAMGFAATDGAAFYEVVSQPAECSDCRRFRESGYHAACGSCGRQLR